MQLGRVWPEAKRDRHDVVERLLAMLPETHYRFGRELFQGKITDLQRRTERGFAIGRITIDGPKGQLEVTFQNENLVARQDGRVLAIVPDLICILDSETAEPITTEWLRYGQRVRVVGVAVPEIMRTPEALELFGPAAFGLEDAFVPIEQLAAEPTGHGPA